MTTELFFSFLSQGSFLPDAARVQGILDAQDLLDWQKPVTRKQAARILHLWIRDYKKQPDLQDISAARNIKDLYDCRVCANHIAQVVCLGLMSAHIYEIDENGNQMHLFEGDVELSSAELQMIADGMVCLGL